MTKRLQRVIALYEKRGTVEAIQGGGVEAHLPIRETERSRFETD